MSALQQTTNETKTFSGNIFIFYAFDIGEDINLKNVEASQSLLIRPLTLSRHYKNYHIPLAVELPHPNASSKCIGAKIHNFGVISLAYKIPFTYTFEELRKRINSIDAEYREQSVSDANLIYKKIKSFIKQPRFFHLRSSYVVIQVDQHPNMIPVVDLKERYGGIIASLLRFETESLSEDQKNEIIDSAIGYYRGDLIIVDIDAAFIYDEDYVDILDLFEFANIQQLELRYYDRILDQHLNVVYQRQVWSLPLKSYLPFIGTWAKDPLGDLGMLKVEISAIIERLESSITLAGEVYVSETYILLVEKLELKKWKESINNKLEIIKDIYLVHQNKIDTIREDMLTVLIIVLIFIELIVGILTYLK